MRKHYNHAIILFCYFFAFIPLFFLPAAYSSLIDEPRESPHYSGSIIPRAKEDIPPVPLAKKNLAYAVYWGCFDPPTLAHTEIIAKTLEDQKFTKLIVVINNFNRQTYGADAQHRVEMLKLATQKFSTKVQFIIQDESHKADYKSLKNSLQGRLFAICGLDSFEKWNKNSTASSEIYDGIIIVPRLTTAPQTLNSCQFSQNLSLVTINSFLQECSSTKARNFLAEGKLPETYLDPAVINYIQKHSLYKNKFNKSQS